MNKSARTVAGILLCGLAATGGCDCMGNNRKRAQHEQEIRIKMLMNSAEGSLGPLRTAAPFLKEAYGIDVLPEIEECVRDIRNTRIEGDGFLYRVNRAPSRLKQKYEALYKIADKIEIVMHEHGECTGIDGVATCETSIERQEGKTMVRGYNLSINMNEPIYISGKNITVRLGFSYSASPIPDHPCKCYRGVIKTSQRDIPLEFPGESLSSKPVETDGEILKGVGIYFTMDTTACFGALLLPSENVFSRMPHVTIHGTVVRKR